MLGKLPLIMRGIFSRVGSARILYVVTSGAHQRLFMVGFLAMDF